MKEYTIELTVVAPEGTTYLDLDMMLIQATKHSELRWCTGNILSIKDHEDEDL